ncbi:tyrosine-type recombinase/integrase [Geodermatophilus ruber]|uniref:Site-specific recombinase XerD n=1 Tax=Geodermatophilus ruber TaxID=504800 RepID=A0A1I4CZR8_9ACTN|nr:tyrosine-type recombinase/integrase [Geodermatophilus ruber]SFK85929.1 Site-specific recombinase XerD [Geodermatophilus ruber]
MTAVAVRAEGAAITVEGTDPAERDGLAVLAAEIESLAAEAADLVAAGRADATHRAYASRWRAFEAWAADRGLAALPADPTTVVLHLTWLHRQGRARSTLAQTAAAIASAHRQAGVETPPTAHEVVRRLLRGHRRATREHVQRQATPVLLDGIRRLAAACDTGSLTGLRDRAVLLVGWVAALRRSEVAALNVEDLLREPHRTSLHIRWSKADQDGQGEWLVLPRSNPIAGDAAHALDAWLATSGIQRGPIFRPIDRWGCLRPTRLSARAVGELVGRYAVMAGLCHHAAEEPCGHVWTGHSLRAGCATQLDLDGIDGRMVERYLRQKTPGMSARYLRREREWRATVAERLGTG